MTVPTNSSDSGNKTFSSLAKELESLAGDYGKYYDEPIQKEPVFDPIPDFPELPKQIARRLAAVAKRSSISSS